MQSNRRDAIVDVAGSCDVLWHVLRAAHQSSSATTRINNHLQLTVSPCTRRPSPHAAAQSIPSP